ncbi:hypothetical protein [Phenylobacterium sp.]|uniref:hypothetical protein n=1 Tax=Phenylobacterium sp. TaxID=1871053 RepID=UPI0035B3DF2E
MLNQELPAIVEQLRHPVGLGLPEDDPAPLDHDQVHGERGIAAPPGRQFRLHVDDVGVPGDQVVDQPLFRAGIATVDQADPRPQGAQPLVGDVVIEAPNPRLAEIAIKPTAAAPAFLAEVLGRDVAAQLAVGDLVGSSRTRRPASFLVNRTELRPILT